MAFADRHTEGKVVSVLEGGYSDRALTGAAMGHVIGLLDRPGEAIWWSEAELVNVWFRTVEVSKLRDCITDREGDQEETDRKDRAIPVRARLILASRPNTRSSRSSRRRVCRCHNHRAFREHTSASCTHDASE